MLPVAVTDADVVVDVHGTPEYVKTRRGVLEAAGVRVRSFPAQVRALEVRESDGMVKAFTKFVAQYQPKNGTPKEKLYALARENISWLKTVS